MKKKLNLLIISFGILSAAGLIAGIAACFNRYQPVRSIDNISIAIFFIAGIAFAAIAIILDKYNRTQVPSTDPD